MPRRAQYSSSVSRAGYLTHVPMLPPPPLFSLNRLVTQVEEAHAQATAALNQHEWFRIPHLFTCAAPAPLPSITGW